MRRVFTLIFLIISLSFVFGDVPVRKEQFIYSILAYNGRDYNGTFAAEDSDTIYLLADVDNFISARKTLVYFWPITGDWKTDTSALNQPFEGTLEIRGKSEEPRTLSQMKYTYFNVRGEYEFNWKVAQGEEAEKEWQHYQDLVDAYWEAVSKYQKEKLAYDLLIRGMATAIGEFREEGKDVDELVEKLKALEPPAEPERPQEYIYPPGPVQKAFILNLPVGEYQIQFIHESGLVMEGSERKVLVFDKRRAQGIGFEVIPGDKWTRPVESKTPSSVIYVDGSTDLYLRPFFQIEYNDLYYEKLIKNDSKGNPNLMKWVRIQQVPKAQLELTGPDRAGTLVLEKPFYVEQTRGSALGYRIVPYDPEGAHKDRDPSLIIFHAPIQQDSRVIRVRANDKNGQYLAGSNRQIRVIKHSRLNIILILLFLSPLLVMGIVRAGRSRKYTP